MIIEIMLIILAIISVIVNTIVSVIIIKDTLNNRKFQDKTDKNTLYVNKEFSDYLTSLAEVKDQLKQNNQQAEANGVKIAMNSLYGKQEQSENNQNGTGTQATNTIGQNIQNTNIQRDKNSFS